MSGDSARAYHEATKHSPERIHGRRHSMDWSNRPSPFKVYEGLPRLLLPRETPSLGVAALEAIASVEPRGPGSTIDLQGLARILSLGAGVSRRAVSMDGTEFYFRTYACAGALYPIEVYVIAGPLDGLEGGVYHFDPKERALTVLREGDHRGVLARACAGEPSVERAPLALVLTGIPWRTAWKYTERGYRHLYWDSGMILANVLALAASAGLAARVVLGFVDAEVDGLLGLDGRSEFTLCTVAIGGGPALRAAPGPAAPVRFRVRPLSRREIEFPLITETNDAGRLPSGEAVSAWRARGSSGPVPGGDPSAGGDPLERVIRRRGSARAFGGRPVALDVLADIIDRSTRGAPTDVEPAGQRDVDVYLTAHAIDGLEPGAYAYEDGELRLLRSGNFRRQAGHLSLDQALGAQAAATLFFMADLERMLGRFGARGYRAAQLGAGLTSGKMHLAAYAHGLGASGLTFYDDEVTRFFSPPAAGRSCMLVTALGESLRALR